MYYKLPIVTIHLFLGLIIAFLTSCGPDLPEEIDNAYQQLPNQLDFNLHVKPILSDKCFACHGPDNAKREAGLRLDDPEIAFAELPESPGKRALVPGNLEQSQVFHRILATDPDVAMPPPEFKVELTDYEKAILIRWIDEGANYKPHWAFIKPKKPTVPKVKQTNLAHNPIDNFIIDKLTQQGLKPSPEAEKELLLRRVSLDLTGLPPTLVEIENFLADESEDAYEKQVDRLLSAVHYGEKMATDWMDLARYSDTYGYQVDRYRDMSPWRDWVISAFNKNMPYDTFITWQLAGDLLPHASREQILATGFNRLHPLNMEDGIVDEEFRVESVADRVAVLGDGLMGLTLSCAKCHDHKYDPISQKEYYQLFSFFNNINETGQISWDKATPVPSFLLPSRQQEKLLQRMEDEIAGQARVLQRIAEAEKASIKQWIEKGAYQQLASALPTHGLIAHYALERQPIVNTLKPTQKAKMEREFSLREVPKFTKGKKGKGLLLDGDAWLDCHGVGVFKRSHAFSIGLWVNIPDSLDEGVIFHKNKGSTLHSFRGYHLYLRNNKLEWVMARTWPENAIIEQTIEDVPRNEWIHLSVTYDGSSSAKGTKIFVNGKEAKTEVVKDNLYKDIVFNYLEDIIYKEPIEPNLQIGARWRGRGLKGAKVDEVMVYDRALTAIEVHQIGAFDSATHIVLIPPEQLTSDQKAQLAAYYLANISRPYLANQKKLEAMRTAYVDSMENVQEIMVMKEMETPRQTYILERGVYDNYGEEVFPNTPKKIMPMSGDLPKNRLGLAQWLTHPDHPLTARVAVNRYWQNYFGCGIVKTTQDFGNQGENPSHPELLDWLAVTFVESGWNVKALQRLIVTSATYRQSSWPSEELMEKDPENLWLARGPSVRLSSEMLRDNALAASGLLNLKVGGESVKPYQPEGLWAMNFDPYIPDTRDKLYRRSLYTYWRRTIPNPTLATFDQPERNVCTVKRQKTNTPLQALVLLNDPTFVEAAKVMGEQMAKMDDPTKGIKDAYKKLTGISPRQEEMDVLLNLQENEYKEFNKHPEKAKGWLGAGEYETDPSLDQSLIASYAVVASVIINGDVSITKR